MPTKRKKVRSKRANQETARDSFLAAARKLFAQKGYKGTSVKDLAQAAGHNPALINYYFGGKEGLYGECMMTLIGHGSKTIERLLRSPTTTQDFVTRFTVFLDEFIANNVRDQDLCLILKRDSDTPVVRRLYKEHFLGTVQRVRDFLKEAKRSGIVRPDLDPEFCTQLILGAVFDLIAGDRFRAAVHESCYFDDKHRAATTQKVTQFVLTAMLV